jgi:hypothetical protein
MKPCGRTLRTESLAERGLRERSLAGQKPPARLGRSTPFLETGRGRHLRGWRQHLTLQSWHPTLRLRSLSRRLSSFPALLLAVCLVQLVAGQESRLQESHLGEAGSGPLLSRSAFAHGYRHGYEEGYHIGNVDINMGRLARAADKKQFHGVKISTGYSSSFGPQASFEAGFQVGLKAGYHDGYQGRSFRAVHSARSLSADLDGEPQAHDGSSTYFDQGVASGYEEGFRQGEASAPGQAPIDFRQVKCPESGPDSATQSSYCGGYRRGFVLGHTDALALRPDFVSLEASK